VDDPKVCKVDAKAIYGTCKDNAKGDFQAEKDACHNKSHSCVDGCRTDRGTCTDPVDATRADAVAACNATKTSEIQTCHSLYPNPQDAPALADCIQNAKVKGFLCREDAREAAAPGLEGCRQDFRTCFQACPASPSAAFLDL
jgi:hypothetical protein